VSIGAKPNIRTGGVIQVSAIEHYSDRHPVLDPSKNNASLKTFTVGKRLGEGAFGSVHIVECGGERFAGKFSNADYDANTLRRVGALQHRGMTQILSCAFWNTTYGVFMPLMRGWTLDYVSRSKRPLTEGQTVKIIRPVVEALIQAHSAHMVHTDIQPANIMVQGGFLPNGHRGEGVLLDPDSFRPVGYDGSRFRNLGYMFGKEGDERPQLYHDIFALGSTMHEVLVGRLPARAEILDGRFEILHETAPQLAPIISATLSPKPSARPTVNELRREL
jgi:eukaryotic-like serine/threonine-protein kinase